MKLIFITHFFYSNSASSKYSSFFLFKNSLKILKFYACRQANITLYNTFVFTIIALCNQILMQVDIIMKFKRFNF